MAIESTYVDEFDRDTRDTGWDFGDDIRESCTLPAKDARRKIEALIGTLEVFSGRDHAGREVDQAVNVVAALRRLDGKIK